MLTDPRFIVFLMDTVCDEVQMTYLRMPEVVEGLPENPGLTAFAVIDFSHIAVHTFTETRELCLDVFSCKRFDYKTLYERVRQLLKVTDEDIHRAVVTYNGLPKL